MDERERERGLSVCEYCLYVYSVSERVGGWMREREREGLCVYFCTHVCNLICLCTLTVTIDCGYLGHITTINCNC